VRGFSVNSLARSLTWGSFCVKVAVRSLTEDELTLRTRIDV